MSVTTIILKDQILEITDSDSESEYDLDSDSECGASSNHCSSCDDEDGLEHLRQQIMARGVYYPHGRHNPPVFITDVVYEGEMMSNIEANQRMREYQECRFCHEIGHSLKDCKTRKNMQCGACGFMGHNRKKCNKIKKGPKGQVGCCTYKKCKGEAKWGHYIVTCPERQKDFGDYIFPEDIDVSKALAPI